MRLCSLVPLHIIYNVMPCIYIKLRGLAPNLKSAYGYGFQMMQRKNERETDGQKVGRKMSKMSAIMRKSVADALMKLWTGISSSE